ncbi:general stress protein [Luteipulveratus mongoliensis]|uniref:Membrane protein n=1 Tax=Luteipulveratus mongoliensis TaxID=571913 RepID=A0A0K1JLN0_9MICO|nr:general stress protein [Luteipulveratus mongoliensis]AKU17629.1 membrane protein [Luteipulveratus mongoliensis]
MSTPGMSPMRPPSAGLALEYPMSLGVFDQYADAQRAVDYLSDHEFPVQNCMIVGTELKQVERVTGRLTWGRVLVGGLLSGVWLGAFVGLIFAMFGTGDTLPTVISTVIFGAIFGAVWAAFGYGVSRGQRDFTSVSQVIATKYEVLVEHKLADRARELLAQRPGAGPSLTH